MSGFFKSFGKGILYVLVLPFLLLGLAIYGVISLIAFFIMSIKGLVLFFTGRSLFDDLPEDKKAKEILKFSHANQAANSTNQTFNNADQSIYNSPNQDNNFSNDPFYVPEYLKNKDEDTDGNSTNEMGENDINHTDSLNTNNFNNEIEPIQNDDDFSHLSKEENEDDEEHFDNGGINDLKI